MNFLERNKRRRIAVAHPRLGSGGSEMTAMWILQALQKDYDLTLVTGAPVEWERLNAGYGTAVDPGKVRVLEAPMPKRLKRGGAGDALRGAFFSRFVRRVAGDFDLCIGTYNFTDFGRPGLQFIADFSWDEDLLQKYDKPPPGLRGLMRRRSPARAAYLATARAIGGSRSHSAVCHPGDVILANSRWSAHQLQQRHGIDAEVVYPPVLLNAGCAASNERSRDFVVLGRVSPEKRIEEAIEVVGALRERGHPVGLHIVGPLDGSSYARMIEDRARRAGPWVTLHGGVYAEAKARLLARHGFALHLRRREAFGIAVAEMVKAGMIPLVPAASAPAEIVGDDRLTFDGTEDAVDKADAVLRDIALQEELRTKLQGRAALFSPETFMAEVQRLAESCVSNRQGAVMER